MEYQNSFREFIDYELIRDTEIGPITFKGNNFGTMHGSKLTFTLTEALPNEELYALFDGTPGDFLIRLKDGQHIISFEKAKKDLKPEETKVSFDFDGTLTKSNIREYAKELVDKGYDVWINTLRMDDREVNYARNWNDDLYEIADSVGIPREKIIFCAMVDKWQFLKEKDFIWHIDDDSVECDMINRKISCRGICHFGVSTWKDKCERLLK